MQGFTSLSIDDNVNIDLVDEAANALKARGMRVEKVRTEGGDDVLFLPDFEIYIKTMGVELNEDNGLVHIALLTDARHDSAFPDGLYEFQHGSGSSVPEAIQDGYSQWAQLDIPVICDVSGRSPAASMIMDITLPATQESPERQRRIILGPTGHFTEDGSHENEAKCEKDACGEEHPFCSCCLVTNSMEAFQPLVEAEGTLGVRLFASRDQQGQTLADVRVNADSFEPCVTALRAYAETWPQHGFELRKQYVVFTDAPKNPAK